MATELEKAQAALAYREAELRSAETELARARLESQRNSIADWEYRRREMEAGLDRNRIYRFLDVVSSGSVEGAIEMLDYWSRRDPKEDMIVEFNSPGGSVIDGLALYDFIQEIRRRGHHVTTIARGMAASMGGVLLQAGDVRIADENASILIHEVSTLGRGKLSELEDELKFTRMLWEERLVPILAQRSNMTRQQIIRKAKRKDWWMPADEALEHGFVDEVQRFPAFPVKQEQ